MAISVKQQATFRSRFGVLSCNTPFRRLWSAQTMSVFGTSVTGIALPTTAILVLHAGSFAVGALSASVWVAWPTLGLFAGVWVDRLRRRPVLITADLLRLCLIASVPLAYAFHGLTLAQLLVVAALTSACTVFFDLAYTAAVPEIVDPIDLIEANGRLELSSSTAFLSGPSLAGILISAVGAPVALVADAVSYALSAGMIARMRAPLPAIAQPPKAAGSVLRELREGLAELRKREAVLRIAFAAAVTNLGAIMAQAVLLLYAYRGLRLHPVAVGVLLTIGACGSVIGALLAPRMQRRLGTGRSLLASTLVEGTGHLLYPLALLGAAVPVLGLAMVVRTILGPLWNTAAVSYRQEVVPAELQGRITAAVRAIGLCTAPIGALIGGTLAATLAPVLGQAHALAATLAIAGVCGLSSGLLLRPGRLRTLGLLA